MARRRYKPEEIVGLLRQAEVLHGQGMSMADAIRQLGISEVTYYRWRKEYGGMSGDQLRRLKDRRQLRAVEAGQPFGLLQDAGMPTAKMDEVVRQRDADLRAAVLHMVANEPRLAVEGLGNGVLETEGDALGRRATQLWLDLDPDLPRRNGDPGADARAQGRDQRGRPPRSGRRRGAARLPSWRSSATSTCN